MRHVWNTKREFPSSDRRVDENLEHSIRDAVTYTGLTQALIAYIAIWGWWDLIRSIRTGDVATDLSRPHDFYWYWAAQDVGRALAQLLLRGLPMLGTTGRRRANTHCPRCRWTGKRATFRRFRLRPRRSSHPEPPHRQRL